MPSFPLSTAGSVPGGGWRPLRDTTPMQSGWDVFDLQRKLNFANGGGQPQVTADGWFGPATKAAVKYFQAQVSPQAGPIDGVAGVQTQVVLGKFCAARTALPSRVLGQMQKESSLLCGIYTPTYANGSQDTGPLQMNTQYHPDLSQNFDFKYAAGVLIGRINEYHEKYVRWGLSSDRAYDIAQGSWNSPVLADRLAKGQSVPQSFLDYVAAVSIYA